MFQAVQFVLISLIVITTLALVINQIKVSRENKKRESTTRNGL